MKTISFFSLTVLLTFAGYSTATLAYEVSVEDISNQTLTCDPTSPYLQDTPPGSCIRIPDGTLLVTVTLEDGDNPDILDNLHITLHSEGKNYQYQPKTRNPSELWGKVPGDQSEEKLLLTDSFPRLAFETKGIARRITLGKFASKPGTKIYVGVRANYESGFKPGRIKEAYEIQ